MNLIAQGQFELGHMGKAGNDTESKICHRTIGYTNTDILNIGRASVVCD